MRLGLFVCTVLLLGCPRPPSPPPDDAGCTPATCESLGVLCGHPTDGCGAALDCGSCGDGMGCNSEFRCVPCTAKSCEQLGWACGAPDDGCGNPLDCGACSDPDTCGGGGTPGQCGCTPLSDPELCLDVGADCDSITTTDNCGGARTVFCGRCSEPAVCGGTGTANRCACPAETDAQFCARLGANCGTVSDLDLCSLPRSADCGTCTNTNLTCGGGGTPNVCGNGSCVPLTCQDRYKNCGNMDDGCGHLVWCGDCTTGNDTCGGGGIPNLCGCTPRSCAQIPGACGPLDNGCGGTITCDCSAPNSCGGGGTAGACGCTPRDCGADCGEVYDGCGHMLSCGACPGGATPAPLPLRLMAANITSGNLQSYDPGEGIRIFQALKPDVVMIQEFNYGAKDEQSIRRMVETAFGPGFYQYREPGDQIPNGVISRYPIVEAGEWNDSLVNNRDFVWAHVDLPGPHDLWVVSLHLLTSNSGDRASEASALVTQIKAKVPASDYLVIGGDLNTRSRTETAINNLGQVVVTTSPYPADQQGNTDTSANRSEPYDWVLVDRDLKAFQVPLIQGTRSFTDGLVFDSRVYNPLSEVAPVLRTDSGATNMQHMGVLKDFKVPR